MRVSNPHELARALEVRSLIANAEMIVKTSLARKETRNHPCRFQRTDFPEQDDKAWFAFSTIRLKNDKHELSKILLE